MTEVKICGITNLEDALVAAKFGADALGFNFYAKSPRYITPGAARDICAELPPRILKVGVFVNEDSDKIVEIAELVGLSGVQLHGDETPEFVRKIKEFFSGEVIKALRVAENFRAEDVLKFEADAILLDAFSKQEYGGTGETFDWEIAKKVQEIFPKMYLAGGLSQDNIANAILDVKPFAVDACSCLESEKGKKNKASLVNFLSNVRFSDQKISRHSDEFDLFFLLRLYRQRPLFYLPQKSITHLCTFIIGYLCALKTTDSEYKLTDSFFREFDKFEGIQRGMFVHSYYAYSSHFLEKCNNREDKAFDLFFAKLEEFALENESPTYE